ncbi:MAG TPA: hypothetical protein VJ600_00050 [Holophagaceae bacterium]|nr:hypothetical protein [Holophagaceae bacterium]
MRRAAVLALPLLLACGQPGGVVTQLPSGHSFRILRAGQVRFEKTGGTAAMLVYETPRRPDDAQGQEKDALELWDYFRPQVERTSQRTAIIQANTPDRALFFKGQAVAGFVWKRGDDGTWVRGKADGA